MRQSRAATLLHERDAMSDATPRPIASRRTFIRQGVAAAVTLPTVAATLAACGETKATVPPPKDPQGAAPPPPSPRKRPTRWTPCTRTGVKAFPAKTEGKGNQLLEPRMEGGVKVFELTAEELQWEVEPGKRVEAWAYNGQVPGPQIRVREGDRVRVNAHQRAAGVHRGPLPRARAAERSGRRAVHHPAADQAGRELHLRVHGARNAGSHMYHSHHNAAIQVGQGLLGAFIVEPKRPRADAQGGRRLHDDPQRRRPRLHPQRQGLPRHRADRGKQGQKLRIRFMNEGLMIHPMHLHGMPMTVIAKDGWDAAGAVEVRHAERRARASGGTCIVNCNQAGHLGLPLPHPAARRVGARHVRHGHGAGGEAGHCLRRRNALGLG